MRNCLYEKAHKGSFEMRFDLRSLEAAINVENGKRQQQRKY